MQSPSDTFVFTPPSSSYAQKKIKTPPASSCSNSDDSWLSTPNSKNRLVQQQTPRRVSFAQNLVESCLFSPKSAVKDMKEESSGLAKQNRRQSSCRFDFSTLEEENDHSGSSLLEGNSVELKPEILVNEDPLVLSDTILATIMEEEIQQQQLVTDDSMDTAENQKKRRRSSDHLELPPIQQDEEEPVTPIISRKFKKRRRSAVSTTTSKVLLT
jgi:hypothetical protein